MGAERQSRQEEWQERPGDGEYPVLCGWGTPVGIPWGMGTRGQAVNDFAQ